MSRGISLAAAQLIGMRVAGQITLVPAHVNVQGKEVSAKASITVYANSNRGTNQADGSQGRTDTYTVVAWNKLAYTCALSLSPGKAIDVFTTPHSYMGNHYDINGQVFDRNNQPIMVRKVGFTIDRIIFGEESAKFAAQEVAAGRRPMNWNNPNHPDFQLWIDELKRRQQLVWDMQSPVFGFARIIVPQGARLIPQNQERAPRRGDQSYIAPAAAGGFVGGYAQGPAAGGFAGGGRPAAPVATGGFAGGYAQGPDAGFEAPVATGSFGRPAAGGYRASSNQGGGFGGGGHTGYNAGAAGSQPLF